MSKKNIRRYSLGKNGYSQKPVSNSMIKAIMRVKKYLQDDENLKYGKNAQEVTFAFATDYVYEKYMKGKTIK